MDTYKENLNSLISATDIQSFYDDVTEVLYQIINDKDYLTVLKVINNKGLLPHTQLTNKFGWKKDYYINYVLGLIDKGDKIGNRLRECFWNIFRFHKGCIQETLDIRKVIERADYVSIGPHPVVDKIVDKLSLHSLLDTIFPDKAEKIMDITTYMIMSENNVMQYFEDYGFHYSLFNGANFTDSTISKLLRSLSASKTDLFIPLI